MLTRVKNIPFGVPAYLVLQVLQSEVVPMVVSHARKAFIKLLPILAHSKVG